MIRFGYLGHIHENGINDAGEVVGTYTDATGAHGFLYNNGTYTTLNDPLAANGAFLPKGSTMLARSSAII